MDFPKDYVPVQRLGEGAIAKVVKARRRDASFHGRPGEVVAIKMLKDYTDAEDVERLRIEVESLSKVRHPNVVRFLEYGTTPGGVPYVVMEWLDGRTLREVLEDRDHLTPVETVDILIQILDALAVCHARGIIHRDIKPENVMLVGDERRPIAKLIDFGMAKMLFEDRGLTIDGKLFGTPQYIAPERITGEPPTTATDIYSVGIMAFEMLTGVRPFDGDDPQDILLQHLEDEFPSVREVAAELGLAIPSWLGKLIRRMTRRNPDQRPTAQKILEELRKERRRMGHEDQNLL